MLNDLLDALFANIGFGRSRLQKRALKLHFAKQVIAYLLGVLFWAFSVLLIASFADPIRQSSPLWIFLPLAIVILIVLWEVGFWFGLVLVELLPRKREPSEDKSSHE